LPEIPRESICPYGYDRSPIPSIPSVIDIKVISMKLCQKITGDLVFLRPGVCSFIRHGVRLFCVCFAVAHMQETRLGRTEFLGRSGETSNEAECYTSVLRNTVRGK